MRTVLITLIGPERTADLVVDADTLVSELLPNLLTAGGVSDPRERPAGPAPRSTSWSTTTTWSREPV